MMTTEEPAKVDLERFLEEILRVVQEHRAFMRGEWNLSDIAFTRYAFKDDLGAVEQELRLMLDGCLGEPYKLVGQIGEEGLLYLCEQSINECACGVTNCDGDREYAETAELNLGGGNGAETETNS